MIEQQTLTSLIGAGAAIIGALLGGLFPWLSQRDEKQRSRNLKRIQNLEKEVRARIALEKAAIEWLCQLHNHTVGEASMKLQLRNRAQERSGLRPKMSESDLEN